MKQTSSIVIGSFRTAYQETDVERWMSKDSHYARNTERGCKYLHPYLPFSVIKQVITLLLYTCHYGIVTNNHSLHSLERGNKIDLTWMVSSVKKKKTLFYPTKTADMTGTVNFFLHCWYLQGHHGNMTKRRQTITNPCLKHNTKELKQMKQTSILMLFRPARFSIVFNMSSIFSSLLQNASNFPKM